MADITRYVNTASSGGDGTTNGESGATAAYASLSAWEAAEQTDLTTGPDIHTVLCGVGSGTAADTTALLVGGWTTDATGYIVIKANPSDTGGDQSAQMPYNESIYRLEGLGLTAMWQGVLVATQPYTRVIGLQSKATWGGNSSAADVYCFAPAIGSVIERCLAVLEILGSSTDVDNCFGFYGALAGDFTVRNCVAVVTNNKKCDTLSGFALTSTTAGTVQNCTGIVLGNDPDLTSGSGVFYENAGASTTWTNCLAHTNVANYVPCFANSTAGSNYNASSDATAPGANSLQSKTFTFAGAGDYHLDAADTSGAKTGGTDLSGTFTDDFDGDTRSAWSIGADEVSTSAYTITGAVTVTVAVAAAMVYSDLVGSIVGAVTIAFSVIASALAYTASATPGFRYIFRNKPGTQPRIIGSRFLLFRKN